MDRAMKERIAALLPELRLALEYVGEEVKVGGVPIKRKDAEQILKQFQEAIETGKSDKISWNVLPLELVVANRNWRAIQEHLNQNER